MTIEQMGLAFELHFGDGFSHYEIACLFEMDVNTLKFLFNAAHEYGFKAFEG